jgi:ATP-grasp domain
VERRAQPGVLLAATLWWPLSARLATRFVEYGCRVSAICPRGHLLRHVSGIEAFHSYGFLDSTAALEAAIDAEKPDIIIPCDDRVVWQLHELYERRSHLRPIIENSLGLASEYGVIGQRQRLLDAAKSLGISVPETQPVQSEDDLRAWFAQNPGRSVLKVDGTWGGSGVFFVDSADSAIAALPKLTPQWALGAAIKRLVVNRDPLSLWSWRKNAAASVTIQRFIEGRPANAMMACWRGEAVASVVVEVLSSQGATGAGIVVRVIKNPEIARAVNLLAERLGLTGFHGLDFVIDAKTRTAHLIEMNPRCTQLGHLSLPRQGDLAGALYAKLTGKSQPQPRDSIDNDVVAFFPQALLAEPPSRVARQAYLDVPWEHPELVRELMLPSWPERQWIARLYHYFRPPRPTPVVDFEALGRDVSGRIDSRAC